VLDPA